jgi:hypothetical protein
MAHSGRWESAPGLPLWAEQRTCASAAGKSESDPDRTLNEHLMDFPRRDRGAWLHVTD